MIGSRGHFARVLAELGEIESARIVVVCDGGDSAEPLVRWCEQQGHAPARFGDDHSAMLQEVQPDAVVVCGPFERHAAMCRDAIYRGVHVLTEKPATLTWEEFERLRDACARNPKV